MKNTLLIMAAGLGSRYGGLKQIDPMVPGGQLLLDFVLYDAVKAGFDKFVFIIREEFAGEFRDHFDHLRKFGEVHYVFQKSEKLPEGIEPVAGRTKPWGTGHAVWCAAEVINEPFTVINADDFYGRKAIEAALNQTKAVQRQEYPAALIAYPLRKTLSPHGTVSRGVVTLTDKGNLSTIHENTSIELEGVHIVSHLPEGDVQLDPETPVSMNLLVLFPKVFSLLEREMRIFFQSAQDPAKSEYYLPSILPVITREGGEIMVVNDGSKWFGITYLEDKPMVEKELTNMMHSGLYPGKLLVD